MVRTAVVVVLKTHGTHWYRDGFGTPGIILLEVKHSPSPLGSNDPSPKMVSHAGFLKQLALQSTVVQVFATTEPPLAPHSSARASVPAASSSKKQYLPF